MKKTTLREICSQDSHFLALPHTKMKPRIELLTMAILEKDKKINQGESIPLAFTTT